MKFLLLTILSLSAVPAFADSKLICRSTTVVDAGYRVEFSETMRNARVGQITIAGETQFSELGCTLPEADVFAGDFLLPILRCEESTKRDSGFSLILIESRRTGELAVLLSEVSATGTKVIERLPCKKLGL